MKVPISITPNPLFTTTIEIRFLTNINRLELFRKMNDVFSRDFPILEEGKIPFELKEQEEQFRYAADYIFKNDDYSLSFSTKSISFEHISEYKYWPTYSKFINESLNKIFELNFIEQIERCGVRYGSILDGLHNPKNILNNIPKLEINNLESNFVGFQSLYKTEYSTLYLQISANAKLIKNGVVRTGLYIDIDSSTNKRLMPNKEIYTTLDILHRDQKELFFSLLKDDFVETLNPKY